MRTLIDIPDADLNALNELSRTKRVSRSELVRSAVAQFLDAQSGDLLKSAFGLRKKRAEDGLAYQQRMRSEW